MPRPAGVSRVLVVDDRAEMAETIADALQDHGYDGVAVTSGHDALRALGSERVDAVVTDLRMPGIDGLAVLEASRRLDPSRPVIVMTAYGSLDTAIESSGRGAAQYLIKPFRIEALVRILEDAFARGGAA
jgi:two-component system response regulator HydG